MKLEQAIKILTAYMKGSDDAEPVDFDTAIKLGIAALKRIKEHRRIDFCSADIPLPGETKERKGG